MGLDADKPIRKVDSTSEVASPREGPSPREVTLGNARLVPQGSSVARESVLIADRIDSADLLGASEAVRPLVELCLAPQAQTPFVVGIVGGPGAGKSFALHRLLAGIEAHAAAAAKLSTSPFLSRVVVASLDAAGVSGDPASALAAAAFAALERERGGVSYATLADEAAHATTDPRRAATAAAERHDEVSRRLETERSARDDVESKRARLSEALLYQTPGSRVDSFIRTSRASIESRLRRFGLADNDSSQNFRDLLRDLSGLGAGSRVSVVLRAMWVYRGQARLIVSAVIAFLLAFAIDRLRQPSSDSTLRQMSEQLNPVADWIKPHGDDLEYAIDALIVLGFVALFLNVWRAFSFSSLLFRGLRLLNMDVLERRRELDASAARLERRVVSLQAEAEATSKRAEAMAQRAGATAPAHARAPGPAFLKTLETPARASREFFAELGRLMSGGAANSSAPQRLVLAIDNLEAMAPGEAARLLETARALAVSGVVIVAACNPAVMSASPRAFARNLFQVEFDAEASGPTDSERLFQRLMAPPAPAPMRLAEVDASRSPIAEPLSASESTLIAALAPLLDANPKALKRFHNAYRLARLGKAPRAAIALSLAALLARNETLAGRLREAIIADGDTLDDPASPDDLIAAIRAARTAHGAPISKTEAMAGWQAARRFAPYQT